MPVENVNFVSGPLAERPAAASVTVPTQYVDEDTGAAYYAEARSVAWIDAGGGGSSVAQTMEVISKTASHVLTNDDLGLNKVIEFDSATPVTLTIPTGLTDNGVVEVYNAGVGAVSLVASGTTIRNGTGSLAQYKTLALRKRGASTTWVALGQNA